MATDRPERMRLLVNPGLPLATWPPSRSRSNRRRSRVARGSPPRGRLGATITVLPAATMARVATAIRFALDLG